jgi:hypothetical protein
VGVSAVGAFPLASRRASEYDPTREGDVKGISHFATGVAAASCLPVGVAAASAGHPAAMILGGVCGLLPDTLDFKVWRYLYRHEIEVIPDPLRPDPAMIAGAVAEAVNRAHAEKRPVRIKLNTVRLATDDWQSYVVRFRPADRAIEVEYGPVVDTGQQPTGPTPSCGPARAPVRADMRIEYEFDSKVDIFDGPVFEMRPAADGRLDVLFLPWHRQWTHSLVVAALAGIAAALTWGVTAGLAAGLGWAMHVLGDQLGFMGSALWFPFSTRRTRGFGLWHAGDALPNATVVWASILVVFWNLWRAGKAAALAPGLIPWMLIGLAPIVAAVWWSRRRSAIAESDELTEESL